MSVERTLDVQPLGLRPDMLLVLQATATDNDEPGGFKTSLSNAETFIVVHPETLLEEWDRIRDEAQLKLEELAHLERDIGDKLAGEEAQVKTTDIDNTASNAPSREGEDTQSQSEGQANPDTEANSNQPPSPGQQSGGQSSFSQMASSQQKATERLRDTVGELREMLQALEANRLLQEEEKQRFGEEVDKPLEALAEDRLPRSATELSALPRSENPSAEIPRAQGEVESIAKQLEQVAERLRTAESFKKVLDRLKSIIKLQEEVIEHTEKEVKKSPTKS